MFKELFERYGFTIETFGASYIADNGVFCVPFTEFKAYGTYFMAGVSFLSIDKEILKTKYNCVADKVGFEVYNDMVRNNKTKEITHVGSICNHDHSLFEVENWLRRMQKTNVT